MPAPLTLHAFFRRRDPADNRKYLPEQPDDRYDLQVPCGTRGLRIGRYPLKVGDPEFGAHIVLKVDDTLVSNHQASIAWDGTKLTLVRRMPGTRNPLLADTPGRPFPDTPVDELSVYPGGRFGLGDTVFTLAGGGRHTIALDDLKQQDFHDPGIRLRAMDELVKLLAPMPADEPALVRRLLTVALDGLPHMDVAAVVELADDGRLAVVDQLASRPVVLGDFRPSLTLVGQAVVQLSDRGSFHEWATPPAVGRPADTPTHYGRATRAVCVRLDGDEPRGLYLSSERVEATGSFPGDYLKFAALAGTIYSVLREQLRLQRKQRYLYETLSPTVREALETRPVEEVFAARQCVVTVLFCDLRGFTRAVAQGEADLGRTWDTLKEALDAMAGAVVRYRGVVGDFQGDAVMGFWGWPLEQPDQIEKAAAAALMIREAFDGFQADPTHPLHNTNCGIGIAHGPAVAGKLGMSRQTKIGVFGSVANRAARLETATKQLRVPILIDENMSDGLAGKPFCRVRRVAPVIPKGFDLPYTVGQLLPPANAVVTENHRKKYETALDYFIDGQWDEFLRIVATLPADGPAEFIRDYIASEGGRPPAGWNKGIPVEKPKVDPLLPDLPPPPASGFGTEKAPAAD